MAVLPLKDAALSTSGDYERFFEAGGVRYHHIIDPRTGRPAQSAAMSVTIVADSTVPDAGMLTDLLTTAVLVLGPEQGRILRAMPHGISGAHGGWPLSALDNRRHGQRTGRCVPGFPILAGQWGVAVMDKALQMKVDKLQFLLKSKALGRVDQKSSWPLRFFCDTYCAAADADRLRLCICASGKRRLFGDGR